MAHVNDAPVVFSGEGIEVALTQETLPVGIHQLIDRAGIAAELFVIKLDGTPVL